MINYILSLFKQSPSFEFKKPKKYVTKYEYDLLSPRQKKMLHSKYELYLKN